MTDKERERDEAYVGMSLQHSFAARRRLHQNTMDRLHPESYRQLRDLAKLHGTVALERALQQIANELEIPT